MLQDYPIQYIEPVLLKDGILVQLRPIHPIDSQQVTEFTDSLSPQSIYERFLGYIPNVSPELIERFTRIDYSKEMAIVAEVHRNDEKQVVAVARIAVESDDSTETEFAVIVADNWQGKGLGTILTDYMIKVAKDMGYEKFYAYVFKHNISMLEIFRRRGFDFETEDEQTMYAELVYKDDYKI